MIINLYNEVEGGRVVYWFHIVRPAIHLSICLFICAFILFLTALCTFVDRILYICIKNLGPSVTFWYVKDPKHIWYRSPIYIYIYIYIYILYSYYIYIPGFAVTGNFFWNLLHLKFWLCVWEAIKICSLSSNLSHILLIRSKFTMYDIHVIKMCDI